MSNLIIIGRLLVPNQKLRYFLRVCSIALLSKLKNFKEWLKFYYCIRINCDIPDNFINRMWPDYKKNQKIGNSILVWHPHSILINKNAKIGNNCVLAGNNVIGNNKGFPVIGDNVFMGVGAVVIGNVTIGDNVKIGANATVTKSVLNDCTVVEFNRIVKKGSQ